MPLTSLQKDVLAVLVGNRTEESDFAGGVVLNAEDSSARFSHDFDIFHELAAEVTQASNRDVASLRSAGFHVGTLSHDWESEKEPAFRKARIKRGVETVEIDWAADSAFRFFPIERDPLLGWRLHRFDAATNKALALAARTETRDYVDIVELHRTYPLPAICWAACGKDPGFSPLSLLKMMRRFARINPLELDKIKARSIDPIAMKEAWIAMSDEAELKMSRLSDEQPKLPAGVAFVDANGHPGCLVTIPPCASTPHPFAVAGRMCRRSTPSLQRPKPSPASRIPHPNAAHPVSPNERLTHPCGNS